MTDIRQHSPVLNALQQLHYPMGLDLGGDAPESVALSILAEMTAALNQRNGGMLKHRSKPIHQVDLLVSKKLEVAAVETDCQGVLAQETQSC